MPNRHLSSAYDTELDSLVARLMSFGGLCETQTRKAAEAIARLDPATAAEVIRNEVHVNALEVEFDRLVTSVLARRQPTARDLRLLVSMARASSNLERVGDEAVKVARTALGLAGLAPLCPQLPLAQVRAGTELALRGLHQALDAFARLDVGVALRVLQEDDAVDRWFDKLTIALGEQIELHPASAIFGLRLLLAAKASERIGDHAKNVAELVIYAVHGQDVRHMDAGAVESLVRC